MTETEIRAKLSQITHRAWVDEKFRSQLTTDSKAVLVEYDLTVGEGVQVLFHVDTARVKNFPIPLRPTLTIKITESDVEQQLLSLSRLHAEVTCTNVSSG